MKIWLDIRILKNENFILSNEIISNLKNIKDIELTIYDDKKLKNKFLEQTIFLHKLIKDKNDIIISFEDSFPIFYKKDFILIYFWIENILYPRENISSIKKIINNLITKKITKNTKKIICFSEKTKYEINEKLNISKDKITILPPFFIKNSDNISNISIKNKHSIKWEYIIYDSNSSNNDLKKFIKNIKLVNNKIELNVIFIWNKLSSNIKLRQYIVEEKIQNKIIFAWEVWEKEIKNYYTESMWVVIVWNYINNITELSNAIFYNCQILAPKLENIEEILKNNILYYNQNSISDLMEKIIFLIHNKKNPNYEKIKTTYTAYNFINKLKEEIWAI